MSPSSIRHIVLLAFSPALDTTQLEQALTAFAALKDQIAEVQHFESGTNCSPEQLGQGYTHCFQMQFADAAARDRYLVHPAHLAFVDYIKPLIIQAIVFDYLA